MAVNMRYIRVFVASMIGIVALSTLLTLYCYKAKLSKEFFMITIGVILFVSPVSIAMIFGCKSEKKGSNSSVDTISIISSGSLSALHCDDPPDFQSTLCIIPENEDFEHVTPENGDLNNTANYVNPVERDSLL